MQMIRRRWEFNSKLEFQASLLTTVSGLGAIISSMTVDAAGNLYIADRDNSRIVKIDTSLNQTTLLSTSSQPISVCVDGNTAWIGYNQNSGGTVDEYDLSSGQKVRSILSGLSYPFTVSKIGNTIITSSFSNLPKVYAVDLQDLSSSFIGNGGGQQKSHALFGDTIYFVWGNTSNLEFLSSAQYNSTSESWGTTTEIGQISAWGNIAIDPDKKLLAATDRDNYDGLGSLRIYNLMGQKLAQVDCGGIALGGCCWFNGAFYAIGRTVGQLYKITY